MKKKLRVGILFGGRSAEHEVSLQSAKNVINAIDKEKYEPVLIGVDKQGRWVLGNSQSFLLNSDDPRNIQLEKGHESVALIPDEANKELVSLNDKRNLGEIDVVFPVLHGTYGEDGTMQGLLKLANVPFVGAGVLGSAIGMDKDVMKRLLRDAGIPVAKFLATPLTPALSQGERETGEGMLAIDFDYVVKELGLPFFVKPANLGSSVGVSKVHGEEEFEKALKEAFRFDRKIIIEEYIKGREIECSVLGNDEKIASVPGELITSHEFYDYEAKYLDPNGAVVKIPAELSKEITQKIQDLAITVCDVLSVDGMGRVDFFVTENDRIYVNEVNTIPGFTNISMYPKLWEASGISQTELMDKLIQLALERFEQEKKLQTTYQ